MPLWSSADSRCPFLYPFHKEPHGRRRANYQTIGWKFDCKLSWINVAKLFERRPIGTGDPFFHRKHIIMRLDIRCESSTAKGENYETSCRNTHLTTIGGASGRYVNCHRKIDRFGSKAPVWPSASHFRSTSTNRHRQPGPVGPFRAKRGRRASKIPLTSI
jgi:hypothetical protein